MSVAEVAPPHAAVLAAVPQLSAAVGGFVSTSDHDRITYARDCWPLALMWVRQGKMPPPPDAVVWPANADEVARLVDVARAHRIGLVPYGGGSGVCGGTWAVRGGVMVDMKRLDTVDKVDARKVTVRAGAGVMGELLERNLNGQGYTLGHFPSSIYMSTLGGWLATRSAGQLSSRYGKIEDMVRSVEAVTGAGQRVRTPERPVAGPDLAPLLIGSEGTLCLFTAAMLRVHPLPEHRALRGLRFRSVEQGLEAIRALFWDGLRPATVRLYDPFDTALVGRHEDREVVAPSLRGNLQASLLPKLYRRLGPLALGQSRLVSRVTHLLRECLLVLMFEGETRRTQRDEAAALAVCRRFGGEDLGEEPGRRWYEHRYDVSYKMSKVVDNGAIADTMEVAATWDKVLAVYEKVREAVSPFAFAMCHFSHAYLEGCSLYFSFVVSDRSEAALARRYDQTWDAALAAALAAGANVSHHHGVGLLKGNKALETLGDGRRALAALKRAFDPSGIMNPGKLDP